MSSANKAAAATTISAFFNSKPSGQEQQLINVSRKVLWRAIVPLIEQMGLAETTTTPVELFDNACGTAVLTQEVQRILPKHVLEKSSFLCSDAAQAQVDLVKKRIETEGWVNVRAERVDAANNDLAENSFTHVALGLAMHIIPDGDGVLANCKRILKNGGTFGATTWHRDNPFWTSDVREAFAAMPFTAPLPDPVPMQLHDRGDWTDPAWIEAKLRAEGFADVRVAAKPGIWHVASADEFIEAFGMMLGWVMQTWWDEALRREHPFDEVTGLVREFLREKYGGEGWDVTWLVICATGRVEK